MSAEFFCLIIDKQTGKLRRIFNPDEDWHIAGHHVDEETEYMRLERKDDWGVPRVPDGMTLAMVWDIQQIVDSGRNIRPGEE